MQIPLNTVLGQGETIQVFLSEPDGSDNNSQVGDPDPVMVVVEDNGNQMSKK